MFNLITFRLPAYRRHGFGRVIAGHGAVSLLMLVFVFRSATAGGFQTNEQSARASAMGGAVLASTDDPSAMFLNPAVLSFLNGTNFSLGATVSVPYYQFTGPDPSGQATKMQPQAFFPPNGYLTFTASPSLALGIAANIPYAIQTEWSPDWPGRRIAIKTNLRSVFITPAIAFRPSAELSIGFALDIAASNVLLSNRIGLDSLSAPEGTATYQGSTRFDYGFQVGVTYSPSALASFAIAYRSRVNIDIGDGSADFENLPPELVPSHPNSGGRTTLTTPDDIRAGFALHLGHGINVMGDFQYTLWSQFKTLSITFKDRALQDIVLPENWKDSYSGRFGAELNLPGIALRAGFVIDRSPIPDEYLRPTVPDADKIGYTAGIGYAVGGALNLDFAISYYKLADRHVTNSRVLVAGVPFNGTYTGSATVFGLNVSYNWE